MENIKDNNRKNNEKNNKAIIRKEENFFILAVETSCDETCAAVIEGTSGGPVLLSNIVASQIDWHSDFGGVVPEIASRQHLKVIDKIILAAIREAGIEFSDLSSVAATRGPGLVGALLVGFAAAKALAFALEIPFLGINHVAGHIYANFLVQDEIPSPFLCLTVSGGHTDLIYFSDQIEYEILGRTRDDAAGEAFDKVARFLELGYPGGPAVEKLAESGSADSIDLPRALKDSGDYDFSFSGLKTAVINYVHNKKQRGEKIDLPDLAASFQQAVVDSLKLKVEMALEDYNPAALLLAGGVAANSRLRADFTELADSFNIPLFLPPLEFCTDNAAMIAAAAYYRRIRGESDPLDQEVEPTLSL